jgi:hypothetical protein
LPAMHIEDMKRWHWALISLVIGLALSYVWSNFEWGEQLPTMDQADFERGVVTRFGEAGHVADITLLPTTERNVQPVMCAQLRRGRDPGMMKFHPALFRAAIPFTSERDGQTYPTLAAYLNHVKAQANPELRFKYAWYRERWAAYALWTAASVLVIGIVWPSVVSLMSGAGLGLMPVRSAEAEYDLSRFGKGQTKPTASEQYDPEEIRRLDEELEKRLAGENTGTVTDIAAAAAAAPEQPVRQLNGGPLEVIDAGKEVDPKEYRGEFYPVEKPKKEGFKDPRA